MRNLALALAFAFLLPFCLALATPAITSSTHPDQDAWYFHGDIALNWAPVTDNNAAQYYYIIDPNPETIPDDSAQYTTATKFETPDKMDGTWYFHLRAKYANEWSGTAHYRAQIDKTKPGSVPGITLEATGKDELTLSWLPATDDRSGVGGYIIFKSRLQIKDVRDPSVTIAEENFQGTAFKDTGLDKGTTYHYVIAANDKAGNRGSLSREYFLESMRYCSAEATLSHSWDRASNTLSISVSSADDLYYASLRLTLPDGNETVLESKNIVTSLGATYDLGLSKKGAIKITLAAKDEAFDLCDKTEIFYYDTDAPQVSLLSPAGTAELSDVVRLEASASDGGEFSSGIESVVFYYGNSKGEWEEIANLPASDSGIYGYDWNTATATNGRFSLKAEVSDKAGNTAETAPLAITLNNIYLSRTEASAAIASATGGKAASEQSASALKGEMVESARLGELVLQADGNLALANELFAKGRDYLGAKAHAEAASALYSRAATLITVVPYRSKTYVFTIGSLPNLLRDSGLRPDLAAEAEPLIKKYSVSRKLEIVEVKDAEDRNSSYYLARVRIAIVNSDRNTLKLQVAEFVPKEFAQNTSELASSPAFEEIRADPIINFTGLSIPFGETLTLIYSLKSRLSRAEADSLITKDVISKFPAPPVVLGSAATVDNTSFIMRFNLPLPDLSAFLPAASADQQAIVFVLVVAVVLILLLIAAVLAAVIIFFLLKRRKR
ncbi:MAG: Ig-like domain-containing protein [Candidatus Diapherotrites archaeon]